MLQKQGKTELKAPTSQSAHKRSNYAETKRSCPLNFTSLVIEIIASARLELYNMKISETKKLVQHL
jgi:hypothetical protein